MFSSDWSIKLLFLPDFSIVLDTLFIKGIKVRETTLLCFEKNKMSLYVTNSDHTTIQLALVGFS